MKCSVWYRWVCTDVFAYVYIRYSDRVGCSWLTWKVLKHLRLVLVAIPYKHKHYTSFGTNKLHNYLVNINLCLNNCTHYAVLLYIVVQWKHISDIFTKTELLWYHWTRERINVCHDLIHNYELFMVKNEYLKLQKVPCVCFA